MISHPVKKSSVKKIYYHYYTLELHVKQEKVNETVTDQLYCEGGEKMGNLSIEKFPT